jgi:K+-transporting ATPase A subunit
MKNILIAIFGMLFALFICYLAVGNRPDYLALTALFSFSIFFLVSLREK